MSQALNAKPLSQWKRPKPRRTTKAQEKEFSRKEAYFNWAFSSAVKKRAGLVLKEKMGTHLIGRFWDGKKKLYHPKLAGFHNHIAIRCGHKIYNRKTGALICQAYPKKTLRKMLGGAQ